MEVWNALLTKTEELSKRRQTMSELLVTQVSDVAKQQKKIKEANFKRVSHFPQYVLCLANILVMYEFAGDHLFLTPLPFSLVDRGVPESQH